MTHVVFAIPCFRITRFDVSLKHELQPERLTSGQKIPSFLPLGLLCLPITPQYILLSNLRTWKPFLEDWESELLKESFAIRVT